VDTPRIATRHARPPLLTVVCVVEFASLLFTLVGAVVLAVRERGRLEGVAAYSYDAARLLATLVGVVGIWRMRRWGVWLAAALLLVSILTVSARGALFNSLSGWLVPLGLLAIKAAYVRRMF
jgi:hypothetical protein